METITFKRLSVTDGVEDVPNLNDDPVLKFERCFALEQGTVSGDTSAMFILVGPDGQRYIAEITRGILRSCHQFLEASDLYFDKERNG